MASMETPGPTHHRHSETATDPVCGMKVKMATAKNKTEHAGHTYYFCSQRCLGKFTARSRTLSGAEAGPGRGEAEMPKGTIFTCPMHPQIRQDGPGSCPICGMALEPARSLARSGSQPGTLGHETPPVGRGGALRSRGDPRYGRALLRPRPHDPAWVDELDPVRPGDAGGAVGGLAVLRARLAVVAHAQPQHVHPDRARHRHGVDSTASSPRWRPVSSRPRCCRTAWCRSISSRRPSSSCLVLVGQVLELRARDATSGAIKALLGLAPRTALKVGADGNDAEVPIDIDRRRRSASRTARREGAGRRRG